MTSSMLAVFERVGLTITEQIIAKATEEATTELVHYLNQPSGGGAGVPDAEMSGSFRVLFEVKTDRGAVQGASARKQLERHLKRLDGKHLDERLLLITPDVAEPGLVADIGDARLVWVPFTRLSKAIEDVVADPDEVASERDRFLLRELVGLFDAEGLLGAEDTVIVAARTAYPEYLLANAYVCQPNRSFRPHITRMGFYTAKAIKREVPSILERHVAVAFTAEAAKLAGVEGHTRLGEIITWAIASTKRPEGESFDVYVLSAPDDPRTLKLRSPISHEGFAWTMGQRYVDSVRLERAVSTADLAD